MAFIHALPRSSRTPDAAADILPLMSPGVDVAFAEHAEQAVVQQRRRVRPQQVDGALIHALGIPAGTLAIGAGSTCWRTPPGGSRR
jgi:hypothetical protein